jgi:hypothetical protein
VHRDLPLSIPMNDDATVGASGALAAITSAHTLTATERERLESSYKSIGEFLSDHDFFGPRTVEVHPQGSMAIGTTTRPEGKAEFDVDLVARLYSGVRGLDPVLLLEKMDEAMGEYAKQHDLSVKPKRRCTQVKYASAMHTDVTPVIDWASFGDPFGDVAGLVPDRECGKHLGTNPRGYIQYFEKAAALLPRFSTLESRELVAKADVMPLPPASVWKKPLAQYVQLFKIHRNIQFANNPEDGPTSTFLTTQIALAYADLVGTGAVFRSPIHLMLEIWRKMPDYVEIRRQGAREEWLLFNPTHAQENLADRMNSGDRQDAYRTWRLKFVQDVITLSEMYLPTGGVGLSSITSTVQKSFGARAGKGLLLSYETAAQRDRDIGRVRTFVPAAAAASTSIAIASRPHTFFGSR